MRRNPSSSSSWKVFRVAMPLCLAICAAFLTGCERPEVHLRPDVPEDLLRPCDVPEMGGVATEAQAARNVIALHSSAVCNYAKVSALASLLAVP